MEYFRGRFIEPEAYFIYMDKLVSMAKDIRVDLSQENKKIRISIYLSFFIFCFMNLLMILVRSNYFGFISFKEVYYFIYFSVLITSSFAIPLFIISVKKKVRHKQRELAELMEIIFNLRKYAQPPRFDPIALTILDFELERMRFF